MFVETIKNCKYYLIVNNLSLKSPRTSLVKRFLTLMKSSKIRKSVESNELKLNELTILPECSGQR